MASQEYRLSVDLNQDGKPELIRIIDRSNYFQATLWHKEDDSWTSTPINIKVPKDKDLNYSLKNLEFKLVEPKYKILDLDGIVIDANR